MSALGDAFAVVLAEGSKEDAPFDALDRQTFFLGAYFGARAIEDGLSPDQIMDEAETELASALGLPCPLPHEQ